MSPTARGSARLTRGDGSPSHQTTLLARDLTHLSGLPERYRPQRLLAKSRGKRLYLATDAHLGSDVVVAAITAREGQCRHNEIQAYLLLGEHPNIVKGLEVVETPTKQLFVTRFYPRGDLAAYLASFPDRRPPLRRSLEIAAQVCRALEHARARGVVHGDVKPHNIFLGDEGVAVLGDFGHASMDGPLEPSRARLSGTPAYMAPEQIAGRPPDHRADLYALGCVLYEMATGTSPFGDLEMSTTTETLRRNELVVPKAPASRNPAIPIALSDLILKLLAKDPQSRPASSRDVRAALEGIVSILPSLTSDIVRDEATFGTGVLLAQKDPCIASAPTLVGRKAEIATVLGALALAESGRPGVVLVSGEPGIGKTRLMVELRGRAEARGALVLTGEGSRGVAMPYRAVVDALLPIAGHLSELPIEDARHLRRLLQIDEGDGASQERPEGERERMFQAVARALLALSERRPLVLILDDLHATDSASMDLFGDLAVRLAGSSTRVGGRILVVAAFRPIEPEHPLAPLLSRIDSEVEHHTLILSPLEEDAIYEVLCGMGVDRPSRSLIHAIQAKAHGNPLFIRELIKYLGDRGALHGGTGEAGTTLTADAAIPASIAAAIALRTARLRRESRELVENAAALGTRFQLDRLSGVVAREPEELVSHLDEAVHAGLLIHDSIRSYRFSHPLVWEVLYQSTPTERRQALHQAASRTLRAPQGEVNDASVIEVAHHLLRAGNEAAPAEVVALCRRAGIRALANYAWHEATEFLRAAIERAEASGELSIAERAELHRLVGYAYFNRGDIDACLRHLDVAIQAFRETSDVVGLARALSDRARTGVILGGVSYGTLADIEPLQEVLERLPLEQTLLRARILSTLAESYWCARQQSHALELADHALDLARSGGDDRLCAQIRSCQAMCHLQRLRPVAALEAWHAGLEYSRQADDFLAVERCLHRIPIALSLLGRLDEATAVVVEAKSTKVAAGSTGDASWASTVLAGVAAIRGDIEGAERHALEAVAISRRTRYPWSGSTALTTLACAHALRGNWAGARQALRLMIAPGYLADEPTAFELSVQQHLLLIDAYADGWVHLDHSPLLTPTTEDTGFDLVVAPLLCAHVEIARAAQRPDLIDGVPEVLDRARRNGVVFLIGWPHLLPRIQGVAAFLQRRWSDADQHFDEAARISRLLEAFPEQARTAISHAEMLAVRNEPDDRSRASALLAGASAQIRVYCHDAERLQAEKLAAFLVS